jgi:CBS domain-containing protein
MSHTPVLSTFRLHKGTTLAQAGPPTGMAVHLESPALQVMTDLTQMRAATIAPGTSLHQAEQAMIYQGVRMLFVVSAYPAVEGLITTTDLHGEKAMCAVHERGRRYVELCVADVMTELSALDAVDYGVLSLATVGELVATLKRHGRNHLLVVDGDGPRAASRLRGLISRTQVERQLGVAIDITPIASSFSEIERALV